MKMSNDLPRYTCQNNLPEEYCDNFAVYDGQNWLEDIGIHLLWAIAENEADI